MKFTLAWLKDHLETDATLDDIVTALTDIGLEVEEVTDRGAALAPYTVAYVMEAKPHPNADKLRVCSVDIGDGNPVQVVCGAPNARTGMKGVFARSGLTVPGTGLKLKPSDIRGVASNGMLVSEREMGLSEDHDGIIEMPDDAPVGEPFAPLLGLDDPVIEIAITPNRQDCLGVRGIARDLAARGIGTLKADPVKDVTGKQASAIKVIIDDDATVACPAFAGCLVKGVKNGPSPAWLQQRLTAIGLRPISALVDITNYVMMDRARPLHVYDALKLTGHIHVRMGREGEELLALDGKNYPLNLEVCVIADEAVALGLGGVMGGESSGCTEDTVDVFVESALFDPIRTALTGRTLNINSDARYRFERGVDPATTVPGLQQAVAMILDLCGGTASDVAVAGNIPAGTKDITFRPARVQELTGLQVDVKQATDILGRLGFEVKGKGDSLTVTAPSWRSDIDGEADLVEEVARIVGYDKLPSTPLSVSATVKPALTDAQRRVRLAKRALAAQGMMEAVTYSFTHSDVGALFGGGDAAVKLANPISSELDEMRFSLLANLMLAASRNQARGFNDLALFEVGPVFGGHSPDDEAMHASGIRTGAASARHWQRPSSPVDAFTAKADALGLLASLGVATDNLQVTSPAPGWYHPGRSGELRLGPKNVLARFGELHPAVLRAMDMDAAACGFEVLLDALPTRKKKLNKGALETSDLQAVSRDFAFLVNTDVAAQDILRAVRGADKVLIADVSLFDIYTGKGVPEGQKSVALAVALQPRDKTLTDADIDAVASRIIAAVEKAVGGVLRA